MANEFDKNKRPAAARPATERDQGQEQGQNQDISKKNPNQETPDRNREGSEEVEKRRAS